TTEIYTLSLHDALPISQTSSSYSFFTISLQTFHHWGALDLSKQTKTIFYITLNIYPSFLNVLNHLVTYIYFPTTRGRSPPLKLQYFIEDQWGHTRTNSQTSSSYRFFTISLQTFHHWGR